MSLILGDHLKNGCSVSSYVVHATEPSLLNGH